MIGQLLTKRQIQGSCGGLSQAGIERVCDCEETCAEHH
ncbi:MAG: (Na+)-NQR maturation NqrM, partial [Plesiomonas shigelloides]